MLWLWRRGVVVCLEIFSSKNTKKLVKVGVSGSTLFEDHESCLIAMKTKI